MTDSPMTPSHQSLVEDLRVLRERGLTRLRLLTLPALRGAADLIGTGTGDSPAGIEEVVRAAAERLETGKLSEAAAYTLGLTPGTRDWAAQDRRRRSAEIYGVTVGHFRKGQERVVLEQLAEQIILLCREHSSPVHAPNPILGPSTTVSLPGPGLPPVMVCVGPIELLTGVDILVSSENVHFEMAKTFGASVSAAIRRSGARRTSSGEIIDDVIQRELTAWMSRNARPGLSVAPGTVADTPPGSLAANGVRRIYHAAVAGLRADGNGYDIRPETIPMAVHNAFRLAERQRADYSPALSSMSFPLFGAGRGGLPPEVSAGHLWRSLINELTATPDWSIRVITNRAEHAAGLLAVLSGTT
jgi:O-acetyl-ADP-ribose deacetylase (regulator of RNase III)